MALTNNIAVIFDFDYTLTKTVSEQPIFDFYNYDGEKFWDAVQKEYEKRIKELKKRPRTGIFGPESTLCYETTYSDVLVDYVQNGIFPGLTLDRLKELGKLIEFYEGVPEFMPELQEFMKNKEEWRKHNINLEFYVISCAIREMIEGSKIAKYLTGLFATEFGENEKGISKVYHAISYNEKMKFIYKSNKGPDYDENDFVPYELRRIEKGNFMYIGDGQSDVPCFKAITKDMFGVALGVYSPDKQKAFTETYNLVKQGRVVATCPADYRKGTHLRRYLEQEISEIADRIVRNIEEKISSRVIAKPSLKS